MYLLQPPNWSLCSAPYPPPDPAPHSKKVKGQIPFQWLSGCPQASEQGRQSPDAPNNALGPHLKYFSLLRFTELFEISECLPSPTREESGLLSCLARHYTPDAQQCLPYAL
jgi:hypothetical protein